MEQGYRDIIEAISNIEWRPSMSLGDTVMAIAAIMTVVVIFIQTIILLRQSKISQNILKLQHFKEIKEVTSFLQDLYLNLESGGLLSDKFVQLFKLKPSALFLFGKKTYDSIRLLEGYLSRILSLERVIVTKQNPGNITIFGRDSSGQIVVVNQDEFEKHKQKIAGCKEIAKSKCEHIQNEILNKKIG